MKTRALLALLLPCLVGGSSALAFHRQSPPIDPITSSGDTVLPRARAAGNRIALVLQNGGPQIYRHTRDRLGIEAVTTEGDNANPAISSSGTTVAWDSDCDVLGCADPGRQIFMLSGVTLFQVTHDPTGTSRNPAINARGSRVCFESEGDLASTGNVGAQQVFCRDKFGTVTQVSSGLGSSANPSLSRSGKYLAFDSTSQPGSGADTGVAQIWLSQPLTGTAPITNGSAPSRLPSVAPKGRFVAWESRAALAGGGGDMGVTQVFAYELTSGLRHQLTSVPGGCGGVTAEEAPSDWRVAFVCGGQGYVHYVRRNERFRLPVPGTGTTHVAAELGIHFAVVSTTADLFGGGTTPGRQVYLLNLFKLPADPVPSDAFTF